MLTDNQINILASLNDTVNILAVEGNHILYNVNNSPRLDGFNPGRGNGFGMLVKRGYVSLGLVRKNGDRLVKITKKGMQALAPANV